MSKEVYVQDSSKSVLENETGVLLGLLHTKVKVHAEQFFCMYLESWEDFTERDGSLKTVFTWCIIKSTFSKVGEHPEGNFFFVRDVLDYVKKKHPEKNLQSVRNSISDLCKRGFIFKVTTSDSTPTDIKYIPGKYMINPKYGIKGSMSENTYFKYVIDAKVVK